MYSYNYNNGPYIHEVPGWTGKRTNLRDYYAPNNNWATYDAQCYNCGQIWYTYIEPRNTWVTTHTPNTWYYYRISGWDNDIKRNVYTNNVKANW